MCEPAGYELCHIADMKGFETFFCLANHLRLLVWAHHHLSLMTIYQYTSQTLNVSPLEVMIVIFTCSHDMETWNCRKRCQWDYASVRNLSYSERWQPCYSLASANHIDHIPTHDKRKTINVSAPRVKTGYGENTRARLVLIASQLHWVLCPWSTKEGRKSYSVNHCSPCNNTVGKLVQSSVIMIHKNIWEQQISVSEYFVTSKIMHLEF